MKKKGKNKVNPKLIIVLCLVLFTLICVTITLFLVLKKEKEIKPELSYVDFEEGLAQEYQLLNCDISEDKINLYLSGIKDSYYTAMCKNIENRMKYYSENLENANQEIFEIHLYKNNTKNYKTEEPEAIVTYYLYNDSCAVKKKETLPSTEKTDGLLPYTFLDFDGQTLTVSMKLDDLSLIEKGKQMKVLYDIAKQLNYIDNLTLQIEDNNTTYVYNGSKTITLIESREINY